VHITPSGNKRQMVGQRYDCDSFTNEIVEKILPKIAATFDMQPDDAVEQLSYPPRIPIDNVSDDGIERDDLSATMNDSNGLPQEMDTNYSLEEFDPNNKTHRALLDALTEISQQSGLVSPGVFKHKVNAEANSITISFVRVSGGTDKLVEKP